jgi:predicted Zn-dependent protease
VRWLAVRLVDARSRGVTLVGVVQPRPAPSAAPVSTTASQIADLRTKLATKPDDPATLRDLGLALLQRVRETADPSLYAQAEQALDRARTLAPDDPLVLVGIGGLLLGKHRFAEALETAHAALALAPQLPAAKAVEVDALVELGRYDDATTAAGELIALRVDLTSLARLSYLRELHGNLDGAVAAMRQAAASPGPRAGEHRLRRDAPRQPPRLRRPSRRGDGRLRPGARDGP